MGQNITFKNENLIFVDIENVRPNEYNPKDKDTAEFAIVKKGIELNGLRLPIVVRTKPKNGVEYEIIDGEQRWTACKQLGYKKIIIYNEGEVSDTQAKKWTLWYEQKVPFNRVDLASLVAQMVETAEIVDGDYSSLELPFSDIEIDEFMHFTEFDFDEFEGNDTKSDKDLDYFNYRVTENQKQIIDKAIVKVQQEADKTDMSEGRCLELLAGDYLAG